MKKTFAVLMALLIFLVTSISFAEEQPAETLVEAIKGANKEIKDAHFEKFKDLPFDWGYFQSTNVNGKSIHPDRWKESDRRLFVYGEPYGDTKETDQGIRYRYIGETIQGEDFLNPHFPHDEWRKGLIIENFRLYKIPWKEPELIDYKIYGKPFQLINNPFNAEERYLRFIQEGLKKYYADAIIGESHWLWNEWHNYVYIQQPPTYWTWGLGSAFHKDSRGIIWYIPIPLPANIDLKLPDLSTVLEEESFENVKPGDRITSTVSYTLDRGHTKDEKAWVRLHHVVAGMDHPITLNPSNPADAPDASGYTVLKPGETKTYRYSFTVQDMATQILSRVNPAGTSQDADWLNNRDEAPVVPPQYDIKAKIIPDEDTFYALDGDSAMVSYRVRVTRKDSIPGEVEASLTVNDPAGRRTERFILGQGYSDVPFDFQAAEGWHTIEAEVWPAGKNDAYPEDNRDAITVMVQNQELDLDRKIRVEIIDI